jgi:O-antigen ligase
MRVDDTISILNNTDKLENTNASTFALLSNARVTYEAVKENPIFGAGLGSHAITYQKYIGKLINVENAQILLNIEDANSLFLRILSEMGLFGLIIFISFLMKYHISKKYDNDKYLYVVNNAVLSMFVIRLLRFGHYFTTGFFFFFWIYYFSKLQSKGTENESLG